MKTGKFFAWLLATTLLLAACGDDDKTQSGDFGEIQVPDLSQIEQTAGADDPQSPSGVTFTTQGAWRSSISQTRADEPDWISISPDHGDAAGSYTIRITLQPNTGSEARTAVITITCGSSHFEISITQKGTDDSGDDSDEDDNSQGRQPNGRPIRITEYQNGHIESVLVFTYDSEGRIVSANSYADETLATPYVTMTFTYESSDKLFITEKYYDKEPAYGQTWECTGGGFHSPGYGAAINWANLTDLQDPKSTRYYGFEYTENRLSKRYEDFYYDGTLSRQEEGEYLNQDSSHSQIRWSTGGTQTFTCDSNLSRHSSDHERLFTGYRAFNPGLCFIYESDALWSLGFLGETNDLLPVKVVTAWPNGTPVTETLSYKYNSLDDWKIGEEIDGMEITLRNSEGWESRYVLTFEGI